MEVGILRGNKNSSKKINKTQKASAHKSFGRATRKSSKASKVKKIKNPKEKRTHSSELLGKGYKNKKAGRRKSKQAQNIKNERIVYKSPEQIIEERENFPDAVKKEISHIRAKLAESVIQNELKKGRRDLRELEIVTIDAEDTRDVDDGVSIEVLDNGKSYMLGVHIADVAHYVKEGTELDLEAYKRGTSVYFPDRVLPMLPAKLSNGICSLNEGEDRLALTVMMKIDKRGNVEEYEIFESIIRVKYKITYKQLTALFEGDTEYYSQKELRKAYSSHFDDLTHMKKLAELRHQMRYMRGTIDFNFPETKVITDEKGEPIDVQERYVNFANNIVEEFMLAANETVAEHFSRKKVPFLYRTHGEPDNDKMTELFTALRSMGYTLKGGISDPSYAIQSLIEKAKGMPNEPIVSMMTLRAMQKAEYSPSNDGHFGLAASYYSHFTSPIRRYPDLFIHRVIKAALKGSKVESRGNTSKSGITEKELDYWQSICQDVAKHCSYTEREAESAERLYTDRLVAKYMNKYMGDIFYGKICNMTSFGMFVKLDNSAEGLVFYNSMPDYMIFDEKKVVAIGEVTRKKYSVGDRVKVKVVNCNIPTGQIEFRLVK